VAVIVTLVPTLFAAIRAAMSSEELERASFVDPALRPVEEARKKECGSCPTELVRPFVAISIRRSGLACFLTLISASLLSAIPFLLTMSLTAAFSFLLYFLAPFLLVFYYVLARRDVFHWWKLWQTRFSLVVTIGVLTTIAGIKPAVVDLIGYMIRAGELYSFFGYSLVGNTIILVIVAAVAAYLVGRYLVSRYRPSMRRRILMEMDVHKEGLTLDGWINQLNSSGHGHPSRDDVQFQLVELVYQGMARIVQTSEVDAVYMRRR